MRPSHLEPYGSQRNDRRPSWSQDTLNRQTQSQSQSQSNARRQRTEDSWIEVASQPSSSSLASLNRDEIITTGLQIRREEERQSQELHSNSHPQTSQRPRSTSIAGSSQDEYEESESESDRVMSSSNEEISNETIAEDGDETSTTLGIGSADRNVFTPQPNAFSHPPNVRSAPAGETDVYFSPAPDRHYSTSDRLPSNRLPNIQRPAVRERSSTSNIQPDHDAALRASLTTLLSCAAAVRKDREPAPVTRRPSVQPTALRLVPGSEVNTSTSSPRSQKPLQKRKSRESSKERHAKKFRAVKAQSNEDVVSPTMMTWFVSAGVVLVFSVISFGAGYAWGKEVGRFEGQIALESSSCGRDALRGSRTGLSKLRLTSVRV